MLGEGPASTEVLQAPGVFMMQKGQFRQCTVKGGEVGKATFGAKGSSDSARRNHGVFSAQEKQHAFNRPPCCWAEAHIKVVKRLDLRPEQGWRNTGHSGS